jgi:hypothetical protein
VTVALNEAARLENDRCRIVWQRHHVPRRES